MILDDLSLIQKELLEGKYTVEFLVHEYLKNIEASEANNSYVEVFRKESLLKARDLDEKIKNTPKELGLLFGAVVSIKDNICYKGYEVTAASKMLTGFISPYSATVVERLCNSDAIIIGRTNCDEFSMGSTSESSFYGPVKNAINEKRVAGGSSGGGAVSVKDKTCIAALGSDTGGSIRQPASFNGILGYKPTYGLVSRWGLIAYASSFDVIGILANNFNTIALIMDVIAGPDSFDSTALQDPSPKFNLSDNLLKGKKVTFLNELIDHPKLNQDVKAAFNNFLEDLKDGNVEVEGSSFNFADYLIPTYYILCTAEASSNLSRFDGVRYGHRAHGNFSSYKDLMRNVENGGFWNRSQKTYYFR